MLLRRKHILLPAILTALVISTSAYAGLYGFSHTDNDFLTQSLDVPPHHIMNYRKDMRDLITSLSLYGKSRNPDFQILVHEGQYLLDKSLWEYHLSSYNKIRKSSKPIDDDSFLSFDIPETDEDTPAVVDRYIKQIDGIVVNNHYCQRKPITSIITNLQIPVISIEECPNDNELDNAIEASFFDKIAIYPFLYRNQAFKKIYHQLIINENADNIHKIKDAKNVSFLINDEDFIDPYKMLDDIRNSNYDIIIIKPIFQNTHPFTKEDVDSMKFKKNGTRRLVLAMYNVSELSDTDYLWNKRWSKHLPNWLETKSLVTDNAYIAKYWLPQWHDIVAKYYKSIVDSGYDGVFLTGLENHEYFERNKPLE